MATLTHTLPGLFNGVSSQSAPLVQDNQCKLQNNFFSSVARGLEKRYGTRFLHELSNASPTEDSYIELFTDTTGQDYIMFFNSDASEPLQIFNVSTGNKATITYESTSKAYLQGAGATALSIPRNNIRTLALADYTVVLNKLKACAMGSSTTPANPLSILYWIKQSAISTDFTLSNDSGLSITVTSPSGNNNETAQVASDITSAINGDPTAASQGITANNLGNSVVEIVASNQTNYDTYVLDLVSTDDFGGNAAKLIKQKAKTITDLPSAAPNGYVVEITGGEGDNYNGYYLQWNKDGNVWEEGLAPASQYQLDATTMPHTLIRTGTDAFLFRAATTNVSGYAEWEERKVGDDVSSPLPSFIGKTINDIVMFNNRLCFLSEQYVIMSVSSDFFNLFPETVTTVLDTDPVDVLIGGDEFITLYHAIPFKDSLLVFSDDDQFLINSGNNIFSAKSVVSNRTTKLPCSTTCKPVASKTNAFFASNRGNSTVLREYFVQPDSLIEDAADVTAHVPDYVPLDALKMLSVENVETIFVKAASTSNTLYAYKYFWSGNEKIQSAWFKYIFDTNILGFVNNDNTLLLVTKRTDDSSYQLEEMSLELALDEQWHIDRLFEVNYASVVDGKEIAMPYTDSSDDFVVISLNDNGVYNTGLKYTKTDTTITLSTTLPTNTVKLFIGKLFESRYRFKEFFVKSPDSGIGVIDGRLQLIRVSIGITNSGGFNVEVSADGRDTTIKKFTGSIVGISRINQLPIVTTKATFPIYGKSSSTDIDIVQDNALPCRIDSASFEARFKIRGTII